MDEPDAIVAVLAGGRGERLGGDKAGTMLADRPLIAYPLAAAHDAGLDVVVVAKRSSSLPPLAERVLYEPERPIHPLCGVLRALAFAGQRSPPAAIVLVACDMPFITGDLLAWLAGLQSAAMAVVGGRAQPTLARCVPAHLPALREALTARRSLREAIEALSPRMVDERDLCRFGDPSRLCFNVNRSEDVSIAERWRPRLAS